MSLGSNKDYKIINHTADIGIKLTGRFLTEIFWKAMHATVDILSGGIEIYPRIERGFTTKEKNIETAFVSILEEIIYLFEKESFLPAMCSVRIKENAYEIRLKGDIVSAEDVKNGTEIKAVTYHQLKIKKVRNGYQATVIFDI
jgi:SHS2 domain-containing protein